MCGEKTKPVGTMDHEEKLEFLKNDYKRYPSFEDFDNSRNLLLNPLKDIFELLLCAKSSDSGISEITGFIYLDALEKLDEIYILIGELLSRVCKFDINSDES